MPSTTLLPRILPRILARRTAFLNTTTTMTTTTAPLRTFSTSRATLYAAKDTMDKDSINTRTTEYSKTGGDDAVAHESEAFDPSQTTPEGQKASGAADKKDGESSNPLNVSPANHEVSKPKHDEQSGTPSSRSVREAQGERKVSGKGDSEGAKGGEGGRGL